MPAAARVGDHHTCPKSEPGPVPHVGGAILPAGCVTVLIHGQPAARVGDRSKCHGPPDAIVMGEPTVLIGNQPAARVGDPTSHGGVIVAGCGCVQIGQVAQAIVMQEAAKSGAAFCEECARKKAAEKAKKRKKKAKKEAPAAAPAVPAAAGAGTVAPAAAVPAAGRAGRAIDVQQAIAHLDAHAHGKPSGNCARYVNNAIVAGGATNYGRGHAWQTGGSMLAAGFSQVATQDDFNAHTYQPQAGDTAVFDRVPGHQWGHVAMYNGREWVSDYRQGDTPFSSTDYHRGTFRFYRP